MPSRLEQSQASSALNPKHMHVAAIWISSIKGHANSHPSDCHAIGEEKQQMESSWSVVICDRVCSNAACEVPRSAREHCYGS